MICSACGRRVDPNRSFCQACGSSVFVEDGQRLGAPAADRRPMRPARSTSAEPPRLTRISTASAPVKAAGCLAAIVRLVIAGAIVWYVGKWLLAIPEVRALVNAFTSGAFTDDQLNAAATAIRDHLLRLLGS